MPHAFSPRKNQGVLLRRGSSEKEGRGSAPPGTRVSRPKSATEVAARLPHPPLRSPETLALRKGGRDGLSRGTRLLRTGTPRLRLPVVRIPRLERVAHHAVRPYSARPRSGGPSSVRRTFVKRQRWTQTPRKKRESPSLAENRAAPSPRVVFQPLRRRPASLRDRADFPQAWTMER